VGGVAQGQRQALVWAFGLNAVFLVVEVVAGLAFGSLALLADAAHLTADVIGLAIAMAGLVLAARPLNRGHSYGFARAEVLAAQLSALMLIGGGIWVSVEAVSRISSPSPQPVAAVGLMVVALVGIAINVISAIVVHRAEGQSLNMRGSVVHLATDAAGSFAALLAGLAIWAFGWVWADPVASLVINVLVLWAGVRLLLQSTHILMEGTPAGIDPSDVQAAMLSVPDVDDVHHLHLWNLASDVPAGSAHIVLAGQPTLSEAQQVAELVKATLVDRFGLSNVTLELEDAHLLSPSREPGQVPTSKEPILP
jgi:cobalt-zinc-cadmium efflux system protein